MISESTTDYIIFVSSLYQIYNMSHKYEVVPGTAYKLLPEPLYDMERDMQLDTSKFYEDKAQEIRDTMAQKMD